MIDAIVALQSSMSAEGRADTEFECLETLLDQMHQGPQAQYPEETKEHLATVLANLTVTQQLNQIKQIWIALTFRIESHQLTQARNPYFGYLQAANLQTPKKGATKSPKKISVDALVESFVAKPI